MPSSQLRLMLALVALVGVLAAGLVVLPGAIERVVPDLTPPPSAPPAVSEAPATPAASPAETMLPALSPSITPAPVPLGDTPWILVHTASAASSAPSWLTAVAPDGSEVLTIQVPIVGGGEPKLAGWWPDGSEIAFVWGGEISSTVFRMPADGGSFQLVRQCVLPCADILGFDGSPDGSRIASAEAQLDGSRITGGWIAVTTLASGETTPILEISGEAIIDPDWSPDGTRLAYWRVTGRDDGSERVGAGRTHVVNADGSGDRAVTPAGRILGMPDWSPDGTRILVAENPFTYMDSQGDLYLMQPDGTGTPVRVTDLGSKGASDPAFSPDGARIWFIWSNATGTWSANELRSIGTDGSGMETLWQASARSRQSDPHPRPAPVP